MFNMLKMLTILMAAGAALSVSPVFADGEYALLGAWETPGGNVIRITPEGPSALNGRLLEVSADSYTVGFREGEEIVRDILVSGNDISFKVSTRIDDAKIAPLSEPAFVRFRGRLDGDVLRGEIPNGEFNINVDRDGHVTGTTYVALEGHTEVSYRRRGIDCAPELPGRVVHELLPEGEREITVTTTNDEPLGRGEPFIAVKLRMFNGAPIRRSEVAWTLERSSGGSISATYYTNTDEQGIAKLYFTQLHTGDFGPANQIRTVPSRTIPAGTYRVTAGSAEYHIECEQRFTVTLARGEAQIIFTDSNWNPISDLYFPTNSREARFRVIVNNPDRAIYPDKIDFNFSAYDAGDNRHSSAKIKLVHEGGGHYKANRDLVLHYGLSPDGLKDNYLSVPTSGGSPLEECVIKCGVSEFLATGSFKLYATPLFMSVGYMRDTLIKFGEIIQDIQKHSHTDDADAMRLLDQKLALIGRAIAVLDDADIPGLARACIAREYLNIVMESGGYKRKPGEKTYRESRGTANFKRVFGDPIRLPVGTTAERSAIQRASKDYERRAQRAAGDARDLLINNLRTAPRTMALMVKDMLASPVYMAYIMVYGATLDGQDAGTVERLLAGLDIATYRLNTPSRIRIIKRIGSKLDEITHIRRWADRHHLTLTSERDFHRSLVMSRFEADDALLQRLFAHPMPDDLKLRVYEVLQRVSDSKLMGNLRAKLLDIEASGPSGNRRGTLARDIGTIRHWTKYLEEKVYWERKVQEGTAVSTGRNRYREAVKAEDGFRMGDHEIMVEWTIPGTRKRIDYAMLNHKDKSLCIVDLTGQYNAKHYDKSIEYLNDLGKLAEFSDFKVRKVYELYWDETAGDFLQGIAAYF